MRSRFRRSIGLGKGVRLNVNKGSAGLSVGVRGARYSMNTSGRGTRSIGIPGTGLYAISTSGAGGRRRSSASRGTSTRSSLTTVTPELAERIIPKAGFLSSNAEKRFREGLIAYLQQRWEDAASAFEQAVESDTRNISDDFFLGATYTRLKRYADAAGCMERVVASEVALPDRLMQKFVPGSLTMQLPITEHVSAEVTFDSVGATLILVELYQELGRTEEAIGLVERLHDLMPDNAVIRLSLVDLLHDANDFASIIELTQGIENSDDISLATLHLRAKALANEGLIEPAVEILTACLRRTANRDPDLLKEIRYNRAEAYELLGNTRKAKGDWSKLVAADPHYRDVRSRLEGHQGASA